MTDALTAAAYNTINEAKSRQLAQGPITLDDMIVVVREASYHKEHNQFSLISRGLAFEPDMQSVNEIVILDAVVGFLETCKNRPADVARRLNKAAGR